MTVAEPNDRSYEEDDDYDAEASEDACHKVCGDIYIPPPPKHSGAQDGQRLVITKIVIRNFKSYGGTQSLGPLHKCFSAIVGPNGSGKSNVIDALLFVFGYRAQKLRLKKLSLLIHNSDTYPNCRDCTVTVHFAYIHDKDEFEMDIIEGSEFTISRTAFKDNSSFYCINDDRVQFKKVSQLLQSRGIDLRYNRFLILQGEVEQISLMKPKAENENESGMLEFLEEMIGTTRLKAPLEKIQERIDELNELWSEKTTRQKLVKKELDKLEKVRNEAIKFLSFENKLMERQKILYQKHKAKAQSICDEVEAERSKAQETLKEALQQVNELKEGQKIKQQECDEINKENEALAKQFEALNETYKSLEKEGEQNRCKNTNTKEKGKKLVFDKNAAEDLLKETSDQIPLFDKQIEESLVKQKDLEALFTAAEDDLSVQRGTLEEDVRPLREDKEKYETELLNLQKAINEAKSALDLKKSDLDQYLLAERQERSKLATLESELRSSLVKLEEKQKLVEGFDTDLPASERRIESSIEKMKNIRTQRNELDAKRTQVMQTINQAKSAHHAKESRNRVLSRLMDQKKKGHLTGIFGRLGDLAYISKKYDIAISTAAGNQLDKILTDNVDTSKKCIEFLKKNDVGRAVFTALDRQQKWRHADFDFDDPAERLIDLIEIDDDNYVPAFSSLLRDTLVVDSLDLARKIAYGGRKWRVVTLRGQLIEISGTMSGGGQPISGKMALSSDSRRTSLATGFSAQELERLENEVHDYNEKLSILKVEHDRLEADIEKAKRDNEIMRNQKPKFEMEVDEIGKTVSSLRTAIEESKIRLEQVKPDEKKKSSFEKEIDKLQKNYDNLKKESKVLEDKVDEINQQIKSIISGKIGPAEKKVQQLKKDLDNASFAISKAEAGKKTAARSVEKCKEKIDQCEQEITESKNLLIQLKERRHKIREELESIDKERQEIRSKKDEIIDSLKASQVELNKMKEEEANLLSNNLDIKHKADQLKKKVEEKERDVAKWSSMIANLKPNTIEGVYLTSLTEDDDENLEDLDINQLTKNIEHLDKEIKKLKPNISAIEQYRQKQAIYIERTKELNEVTQRRDNHRKAYEQVKDMRHKEFEVGFMEINKHLAMIYETITSKGGSAELIQCDSLDPFLEGIEFKVRPPKKTWGPITKLSGGEKTLSSLALILALHLYKPSPLYVMDEIDAALDFKNVSIIAHYIKEKTKDTQFLVISLRNNMYELADRLIGITKIYNSTNTLTFSVNNNS